MGCLEAAGRNHLNGRQSAVGQQEARRDSLAAPQGAGNVYLVKENVPARGLIEPEWAEPFIHEHPHLMVGGAHDDRVDAAALGFNELAERGPQTP